MRISFSFRSLGARRSLAPMIGLLVLVGVLAGGAPKAEAQSTEQFSRSYVTPFPDNDQYNIYMLGDSLGDGLWHALDKTMKKGGRVQVFKLIRYSAGFARTKSKTWKGAVENTLKNEQVNIAVVFVGASERISVYSGGKKHGFGSEKWREAVSKQVDDFIKRLKKSKVAIYWVGLPVMRSPKVNQQMQVLNEIFRERTFLSGVKFIDTWNAFADQFGRYSAFGPDLTGQVKRLRVDDGIHFTGRGNLKLAHFVEKEIRKDFALARAERNIPLAGSEEEQRRSIKRPKVAAKQKPGEKPEKSKDKTQDKDNSGISWFGFGKTKTKKDSEDNQVTIIDGIEILRPKIPDLSAGIIGQPRVSQANAFVGEQIAKDTDGDLTALGSVSSINSIGLRSIQQRVPVTQSPYYKVLIKGEKLPAKPGRADDFSWPNNKDKKRRSS